MKDKLALIRSLLQSQTTLVLATAGEDGLARSTPLFFIADQQLNLYWFSSRSSLHSRNIKLRADASVAISSQADTWQQIQGVQMQGHARAVTDLTLRKTLTPLYVERFSLGKLFSVAIQGSTLYRFTPTWVRYLDNSHRFGYKFELTLPAAHAAPPSM